VNGRGHMMGGNRIKARQPGKIEQRVRGVHGIYVGMNIGESITEWQLKGLQRLHQIAIGMETGMPQPRQNNEETE
jgi:hypothetical protein